MSDMKFFMANAVLIIMLAFSFSHLEMAEWLHDDDVVIGDGQYLVDEGKVSSMDEIDFDTRDLVIQFENDWIDEYGQGVVWDGSTNDRDEEYGYLVYDVSDIDDAVVITVNVPFFVFWDWNIEWYYDGERQGYVPDGRNEWDVGDVDELEFRFYDYEEQALVDIFSPNDADFGLNTYEHADSVTTIQLEPEEGAFTQIASSLSTGFNILRQIPTLMAGWFRFITTGIPSPYNVYFTMYIGILFTYFLVTKVWIG